MRPALVTDSNSQLPSDLAERFGVRVVPIPVVVNGTEYLEGVDLDADGFYAHFDNGTPEVSTSQPSPGAFVETYQACLDAGYEDIVSIHVGEVLSGTINSARVAAGMVDATVHLVDTGTGSFGISCCVWTAGEVLANGGSTKDAIEAAEQQAGHLYSVTALAAADLVTQRIDYDGSDVAGIDVLRSAPDGSFASVGAATTVDDICDLMAKTMHLDGAPIRVALGIADQSALPYYEGLESRLRVRDDVVDIVRYRIGPSVGAFTGLGTAGGFWYPA